jgi:hypothetical protein
MLGKSSNVMGMTGEPVHEDPMHPPILLFAGSVDGFRVGEHWRASTRVVLVGR